MKKKLIIILLALSVFTKPVLADDLNEESISAESVSYEETGITLPTSFDGRTKGLVTSVKDQGSSPYCLTYARIAALESSLIKKGYEDASVDLSEMHMLYERWSHSGSASSFGKWCRYSGYEMTGGSGSFENQFIYRNFPVYEFIMPMTAITDGYMPDTVGADTSPYEIAAIYSCYTGEGSDVIKKAKEAVYRFGGIAASLLYVPSAGDSAYKYFGSGDYSYYLPEKKSGAGHAVEIIGWDDNYSKNNFSSMPPANGAFLCKNSWGKTKGSSGYFWLSYYSQSGLTWEAFDVAPKGKTARGIEVSGEITLYPGQTSKPVTVKMIPESADQVEWYIDIPESDEYLKANADHSITCKRFQEPGFGAEDTTKCKRTVMIRSKDRSLGLSAKLTVTMMPNMLKAEGDLILSDSDTEDLKGYVSVSPVSEKVSDVTFDGGSLVSVSKGTAKAGSYGEGSIVARLDGQSVKIPCRVYCTGFDLGENFENGGYINAFLQPTFPLSGGTDQLKSLITYTSSDESVAKVEGDCIYFIGNGKATIYARLCDEVLTNGIELTDSVNVTVSGIDMGQDVFYEEPASSPETEQMEPESAETVQQTQTPMDVAAVMPPEETSKVQKTERPEKAPARAVIRQVKVKKGKLTVKWKKVSGAVRYEIQISSDKSFKKGRAYYSKKDKITLKGLSEGKYYIRIRALSKKKSSKWSKKKAVYLK